MSKYLIKDNKILVINGNPILVSPDSESIEGVTIEDNNLIINDENSNFSYVTMNLIGNLPVDVIKNDDNLYSYNDSDFTIYEEYANVNVENGSTIYVDVATGGAVEADNLMAENIKGGVNILGVIGTYTATSSDIVGVSLGYDEINECNKVVIDSTDFEDYQTIYISGSQTGEITISDYADIVLSQTFNGYISNATGAQVSATNLTSSNIKTGVNILGVTGSYTGESIQGVTQNGNNLVISGSNIDYISLQTPVEISLEAVLTIDEIAGGSVIRPNEFSYNGSLNILGNTTLNYTSGTVTTTNLTAENIKSGVSILGVTGSYEGGGGSSSSTPDSVTLNNNVVLPYPPIEIHNMKWFITLSNDSSKYQLYVSLYGFGYRSSNFKCVTQKDTIDSNYAYSYAIYETSASNPTTWTNVGCGTTSIPTLAWNPKASNHDIYVFTSDSTKSTTIKSQKTTD